MSRFSLNPLFLKLLILSFCLMVGWAVFMKSEMNPLTADDVIKFEFAGTKEKTTEILKEWEQRDLFDLGIHSIYLDFVFIFFYTATLALGCLTFPSLTGKVNLMNWGLRLYRFSLYAGLADFVENICLMKSLHGTINNFYSMGAFGLATVKFSIIVIVLIFLFRCIIQWIFSLFRSN